MATSIVFMGTPEFAVPILQSLIDNSEYDVKAVLTQPDHHIGRKKTLHKSPVKELAEQNNIEVLQPAKLSKSPEMEKIIAMKPDLMITAAYGQFLPTKLLAAAQIAAINVHGSLLPKYRGGAPIQYSIINGDKETGVSIMYMVKKMDAGDVLAQKAIPIEDNDDSGTMFKKLSLLGRDLLLETLPKLISGDVHPVAQDPDKVVFSPNITSEQEQIDYHLPARLIDAKVRGLRPAPLGNMVIDGLRTKIYDVTPLDEQTDLEPGKAVRVTKHQLVIAAGDGTTYQINKLKPAGKKAMDITSYLNGHKDITEGGQVVSDD
ncbi:methionyl-tRNA formyltransferase [Limosilactobacillus sp. RRLNB_1_1]|uniref:Methionyl-tRNA formyltransferase n=1 Tax=Limosilactobacillus albertensis TaxID=2759752 RepID=A0A7W3TST8_9LACO|nr:methionyl-tRNA formyltransferase [Limosilactobacillus albertensis]MBB1070253.1 methionyl-tRNA formyltransferase [Limosilactobacillus albertensis]MBB1124479.1 methionyl-tRNA formyltransferase [Limosilactobacillus albertensis]MCD7119148.1 methionyl-tRNA formyltransferase [Limosilactobacillus albertensis]MCD7123012.1 methionyl-tRNA formyltransferase [Limosilactobacillus albertensis]MCD7129356.1 methionyl-tRNA formyltransferase [Limosilactobacillus albertensis]